MFVLNNGPIDLIVLQLKINEQGTITPIHVISSYHSFIVKIGIKVTCGQIYCACGRQLTPRHTHDKVTEYHTALGSEESPGRKELKRNVY